MNKWSNTPRPPNIKADSPEVKEVVDFAESVKYMLDVKINQLRIAMVKSEIKYIFWGGYFLIRTQVLEWVQGKIQDLILW